MKKILTLVVSLVTLLSIFTIAYADDEMSQEGNINTTEIYQDPIYFSDLNIDDWFYEYVKTLHLNGIISGYSDKTFRPYRTITVGEAVAIATRINGIDCSNYISKMSANKQSEVSNVWCSKQLMYAYDNNMITYEAYKNFTKPITRFETARLFSVALDLHPCGNEPHQLADTNNYYVVALFDSGIVNGFKADEVLEYRGKNNISRAEFSAIAFRAREFKLSENQSNIDNNKYFKTSNNKNEYIALSIQGNNLYIKGIINDTDSDNYLCIDFGNGKFNKLAIEQGREFTYECDISHVNGEQAINIYTKEKGTMFYYSNLYRLIFIQGNIEDGYEFIKPIALETNLSAYNGLPSNPNDYIEDYKNNENYTELYNFTLDLTKGIVNNYDKALKIHDWITENIYYDKDVKEYSYANLDSSVVFNSGVTINKGYTNLFKTMLNMCDIPCIEIIGSTVDCTKRPVVDIKQMDGMTHSLCAVYIDNRWVLVDITWDCFNKKENETLISNPDYRTYFDPTIELISMSHKFNYINK